jgi:HK97 family phage prohead protease
MTLIAPRVANALRGRKTFVFEKASIDAAGTFDGYGAIFNNLDDGGDIIKPGFFADVLDDFLREGFMSWGHDWLVPCAMPTKASEDEVGLAIAGRFHSDPESQRYRTIAAERLANGQTMGLSIGYEIAPGGARQTSQGRLLLKASRLFEVGFVMVPMNREAGATDVKTVKTLGKAAADNAWTASYVLSMILDLLQDEAEDLDPADPDYAEDQADVTTLGQIRDLILQYLASTAREVGTPDDLADVAEEEAAAAAMWSAYGWMGRGVTFEEHKTRVERAVKTLIKRAGALARLRKEGRVLSSSNRDRLQGLSETLAGAMGELQDLLASTDGDAGKAVRIEAERARLLGVQLN